MNPILANAFAGIRVIQSDNALAETAERLFPTSRHRSARIRKKLIQRHGSEFRKVPTAYQLASGTLICHPMVYRQINEQLAQSAVDMFLKSLETYSNPEPNSEMSLWKLNAAHKKCRPPPKPDIYSYFNLLKPDFIV